MQSRDFGKFARLTIFVAGVGALAMAAPVSAAPAVRDWIGWYAGLNAGGAWGRSDANTSTAFAPLGLGSGYFAANSLPVIAATGAQTVSSSGAVAGGQLGYNWQSGSTVLGFEADLQYFGTRGTATNSGVYLSAFGTGFTINSEVKTDWLFTARPRLGWAVDNWLLYVTGGVAVSQVKGNFTFSDTFATGAESASIAAAKVGWTAGAGVEWIVQGPWNAKVEYLHVDLGAIAGTSTNFTAFVPVVAFPANVFTHSVDLRSDIVRVGLNYRFH
jgi:outer membrane immunogenic protein